MADIHIPDTIDLLVDESQRFVYQGRSPRNLNRSRTACANFGGQK